MIIDSSRQWRNIGKITGHDIFLWYSDTGFDSRSFYNYCSYLYFNLINGGWLVRVFRLLLIFCYLGFFLMSCSGGSDDGGTRGGGGETQAAAADNSDDVASPSNIWLDAWEFACSDNWETRDNAVGLVAYSGPGSCSTTFPGEAGNYNLTLSAVSEFDGESLYRVSINGVTIQEGAYSLSSPLGCDCPLDQWREVCPDQVEYISLGKQFLNPGDVIEFWGDDVYPCGEHGAYAKWLGIQADKI